MNEEVQLKGIFFKQWSYNSDFVKQYSDKLRQPAPLLIGLEPEVVPQQTVAAWGVWASTAMMVVIVFGIGVIWFGARRFSQSDAHFERKFLRKYTRGNETPRDKLNLPPNP